MGNLLCTIRSTPSQNLSIALASISTITVSGPNPQNTGKLRYASACMLDHFDRPSSKIMFPSHGYFKMRLKHSNIGPVWNSFNVLSTYYASKEGYQLDVDTPK